VNEAETLATLANEHGFSYYEEGTAVLERSLTTRAPAELLRLVELARQTGLKLFLIDVLAALAEAYGRMGDSGRGLDHISDAFAEMEDSSKGSAEAELHRIKGELLLVQDASNAEQARQFLHKAIEVARRQEAKFYELRATMGLARLLAKQGRRDEAHAMLADIYAWFTEGFDTTDLKEARALLDQLAG
jgi:tetratricopeptide (TPR) repeat protein